MESAGPRQDITSTAQDARAALADAEAARRAVSDGVSYPPSYRPLIAFSGASLPLLMTSGSGGVPSAFVSGVFLVIGVLGVAASGGALSVFESSNGVRITGLRSGKRLSAAYLAATLAILIAVAAISHATDAWWVALVASPVGAAIAVWYSNAWLADYRRHNA